MNLFFFSDTNEEVCIHRNLISLSEKSKIYLVEIAVYFQANIFPIFSCCYFLPRNNLERSSMGSLTNGRSADSAIGKLLMGFSTTSAEHHLLSTVRKATIVRPLIYNTDSTIEASDR